MNYHWKWFKCINEINLKSWRLDGGCHLASALVELEGHSRRAHFPQLPATFVSKHASHKICRTRPQIKLHLSACSYVTHKLRLYKGLIAIFIILLFYRYTFSKIANTFLLNTLANKDTAGLMIMYIYIYI